MRVLCIIFSFLFLLFCYSFFLNNYMCYRNGRQWNKNETHFCCSPDSDCDCNCNCMCEWVFLFVFVYMYVYSFNYFILVRKIWILQMYNIFVYYFIININIININMDIACIYDCRQLEPKKYIKEYFLIFLVFDKIVSILRKNKCS